MNYTNVYSRYNLPKKVQKENTVFSLICRLEKELAEICEGNDEFILAIAATRKSLKILKKFF